MPITDNHYLIGSMHVTAGQPCQDHALSGSVGDAAFAVVSDGCSSGGMTDVGARFMTLSIANAFASDRDYERSGGQLLVPDPEQLEESQSYRVRQVQASFGLARNDLLATCLYAYATPLGAVVRVRGDGAVAVVRKDGSIALHRFEWRDNTPFYPIYLDDAEDAFMGAHGNEPDAFTMQSFECAPNGPWKEARSERMNVSEGMRGSTLSFTAKDCQDIAAITVFTDGVFQVEGVEWKEAVRQLTAFKGVGAFAKRRMIRFVQDARKLGKGPIDDIAYATIRFADDAKEEPS